MKRGRYSEGVRIVQIDTHFVETDAVNFRAVVQSLTGKNSTAVWDGNGLSRSSSSSSSLAAAAAAAPPAETGGVDEAKAGPKYYDNNNYNDAMKPTGDDHPGMVMKEGETKYEDDDYVLSFMKADNLYFNDFDKLLSEFALIEERPLL